jgi:hypothetical protein
VLFCAAAADPPLRHEFPGYWASAEAIVTTANHASEV